MQNNKVKRNRLKLLKILGLIFILWIVIRGFIGFKQNAEAIGEYLPPTYSITTEESSLIAEKYRGKLKVVEVNNSKVRAPISTLLFNKKYHVVMYKIDIARNVSMQHLFQTSNKRVDVSTGYSYGTIGKDIIYRFRYKAGATKAAYRIYLTLAGDSLQTIVKNDSIISYHLQCDNVSIKYEEKEPVDILIIGEEKPLGRTSIVPMDILFLKRNGCVYLLIMTPNDYKNSIPPDLLYNIVSGAL